MEDNNLKLTIAIVVIIGILLIGVLFVIPIGSKTKNKSEQNDIAITNISDNNIKTKKKVKSNSIIIDDENQDILQQRHIFPNKYYIDSKFGQAAELYNSAIDQMLRSNNIVSEGYLNDEKIYTFKLDLENVASYLYLNIPNETSGESYTLYDNNCYKDFSKDLNDISWASTSTSATLMQSRETMINYFIFSTLDLNFLSHASKNNDWNIEIAEDEYVNDYLCYKIIATQENIEKTIYIIKDLNIIAKMDAIIGENKSEQYFSYNTGEKITLPQDILDTFFQSRY